MRSRFALSASVIFLVLLLAATLGAAALVAVAPANAAPPAALPAGPPGSADEMLALLAVQQAQLTAGDGASSDFFGYSVAISGDTAVVGAYNDTVGSNAQQGSAYIFVRSGATWSQQAQLTATDGAASDCFGYSVALAGETAVVGAPFDVVGANAQQGSAYVFTRSGTTWSQQAQLTALDGAASDYFGFSVAISGDTAVVGAYMDDVGANGNEGSAYVFTRSGTTWSQQAQLTAGDGNSGDHSGNSVAISGNTAVVGAQYDTVGVNAEQGSACVFTRGGGIWSEQQKLTAADGHIGDLFGCSVALSGDTVVVSAYDNDVGANVHQGSAYIFTRSGSTWSEEADLTAADGAAGDFFGYSVAISGETVVAGAYMHDVDANVDQGWACVFARSGSTWSEQAQLSAVDGASGDYFGYSVALSGDIAVVGAYFDNVAGHAKQGSAYVFTGVVEKPGKPVAKSPKGLISSRTPTFRWTAASGAATYEVRVNKGSKLIKKKTGITKLSWKCTRRLPRGVRLSWKVRGRNGAGAGPWSNRPWFKVR
jgi:hypothetical protein